jgi:hypothetical protein
MIVEGALSVTGAAVGRIGVARHWPDVGRRRRDGRRSHPVYIPARL